MSSTRTARSTTLVKNAAATAATPTDLRPDSLHNEPIQAHARHLTGGSGMSDAMRTIVWVTGVAFGVFAPGAFAQSAFDAGATQKNSALQKLDANHDGFISREEAKQNPAIEAVFSQADMNKDGKLDEDELIKALSISQRETVAKIAVDGASAAKQYAADSEVK